MACPVCGTTTDEPGSFCPACGRGLPSPGGSDANGSGTTVASAPMQVVHAADTATNLTGQIIGDFALEGVIGGGSFGTVYRARQIGLDRPAAVKVPTAEIAADPVAAHRFAREARAAARIVHPGVVAIYAVGELADGRPYLAMQLIDGEPLDAILAGGPIPPIRALGIARDIAGALAETHAAGVIHRDLKPSNVMWRRDRHGGDRITLVDFGIAVGHQGAADATRLTDAGLIGTPHYMSPEQAHGEHVDGRADLYALGCLLFELITGDTPFIGSGFEVLVAHLSKPAPRASERIAVPVVVDRLIAQLMEKRPDDRPASADAVVQLIDAALAELTGAPQPPMASAALTAATTAPLASRPPAPPAMTTELVSRPLAPQAITDGLVSHPPMSPAMTNPLVGRPAAALSTELAATKPRRGLAIGLAGLAVVAVAAVAGLAALRATARPDDAEPRQTASGALVSGSGELLRQITRDDGELIILASLPDQLRAKQAEKFHLEIKNKLGSPIDAAQVIVTFEDAAHHATAVTVDRHGSQPGHYAFQHAFAEAGDYVMRIFPSASETVSTIDLAVEP